MASVLDDPEKMQSFADAMKSLYPQTPLPLPNGGLSDDAVDKLSKQQTAAMKSPDLSKVDAPDSVVDHDEDSDDEPTSGSDQPKIGSAVQTLADIKSKNPVNTPYSLSDSISRLLAQGTPEDNNLLMAQQLGAQDRTNAGYGKAANMILGGVTHTNISNDALNDIDKNADQYKNAVISKRDFDNDKLKQTKLATDLVDEQNKADPNSDISQQYRQLAQRFGGRTPAGSVSAADLEKTLPWMQKAYDADQKNRELALKRQELNDNKQSKSNDQALQQTQMLLESARGNPEVQQALKDRYAAGKAREIFDNYGNNKLSTTQLGLFVPEVAKIASGGVPGIHELEQTMPNSVVQKLRTLQGKLLNSPVPSDADEYIKTYKDYLGKLEANANNVVNDKFGRVIESKKKSLGDDYYDVLKKNYLPTQQSPTNTQGASQQSKATPGSIIVNKQDGKKYRVGADGDSLEAI